MTKINNNMENKTKIPYSFSPNNKKLEKLENNITIPRKLYEKINGLKFDNSKLNGSILAFHSKEIKIKYYGLVGIRKLLSIINNELVLQKIDDMELFPKLINILDKFPNEFKYQALRCINNILEENSNKMYILLYGGINKIIACLDSNVEEIVQSSIYILGNMAEKSDKIGKILYNKGIFDKLLNILSSNNTEIIKIGTRATNNFFTEEDILSYENINKTFQVISKNLIEINCDNEEFISDSCYIIATISFYNKKIVINERFTINLIPKLISFLDIINEKILLNALNIIDDISSGKVEFIHKLITLNLLDKLKVILLNEDNPSIIKEAIWILSNIACGTEKDVEVLIDNNFCPLLVKNFINNDNSKIRKATLFAICNILSIIKVKKEYIEKIVNKRVVKILIKGLNNEEPVCKIVSLKSIKHILICSNILHSIADNPFVILFQKLGIFKILENLKLFPNQKVQQEIDNIIQIFNCIKNK